MTKNADKEKHGNTLLKALVYSIMHNKRSFFNAFFDILNALIMPYNAPYYALHDLMNNCYHSYNAYTFRK